MTSDELYEKIEPELSKIPVMAGHLEQLKEAYNKISTRDNQDVGKYITDFEKQLSENLQKTIIDQNAESQRITADLIDKAENIISVFTRKNEELLSRTEMLSTRDYDLKFSIRDEIEKKLDVSGIQKQLVEGLEKAVEQKVNPVIEKLDNSATYYVNAGKAVYEGRKDIVPKKVMNTFYCVLVFSFLFAISSYRLIEWAVCENVFDKFYSDRYEKEISEPLKTAELEAEAFLKLQKREAEKYSSEKKKEADIYLKEKKAEADKYLEEQLAEARKKAQEEFDKRMDLYSQQVHKEVDKSLKKSKPMEN